MGRGHEIGEGRTGATGLLLISSEEKSHAQLVCLFWCPWAEESCLLWLGVSGVLEFALGRGVPRGVPWKPGPKGLLCRCRVHLLPCWCLWLSRSSVYPERQGGEVTWPGSISETGAWSVGTSWTWLSLGGRRARGKGARGVPYSSFLLKFSEHCARPAFGHLYTFPPNSRKPLAGLWTSAPHL